MFDAPGLTWQDRIENYNRESGFPASLFVAGDGRVVGTWLLGNNYRRKQDYHGEYPPNYLKRIRTLFPDKESVLHLCSGMVDTAAFPGDTVDMNPALNPTYIDDAQTLRRVPLPCYDLVLADPPYTDEDATKYGVPMLSRKKVMIALLRLRRGAHVVWLDQAWPQYSKEQFALEGIIGLIRSTNHRVRGVFIYRRI